VQQVKHKLKHKHRIHILDPSKLKSKHKNPKSFTKSLDRNLEKDERIVLLLISSSSSFLFPEFSWLGLSPIHLLLLDSGPIWFRFVVWWCWFHLLLLEFGLSFSRFGFVVCGDCLVFFFQFGFDGNDSLSVSDGCGWWMVLENGLWFWLMKVYWWKIMIIATEIVRKKRETILFLFFWCCCRFWVTVQRRNFWFGYSAAFPALALEFVSEFILTN
jgi:hypothetical protein